MCKRLREIARAIKSREKAIYLYLSGLTQSRADTRKREIGQKRVLIPLGSRSDSVDIETCFNPRPYEKSALMAWKRGSFSLD